jgi:hypothetical protein
MDVARETLAVSFGTLAPLVKTCGVFMIRQAEWLSRMMTFETSVRLRSRNREPSVVFAVSLDQGRLRVHRERD